jgi:hypothetical protein
MNSELYRYQFPASLPLDEIEATLALAFVGAEALHGESQVALDGGHLFDVEQRCCVIDASTAVGKTVSCLFTGFLRCQFGFGACRVERLAGTALGAA